MLEPRPRAPAAPMPSAPVERLAAADDERQHGERERIARRAGERPIEIAAILAVDPPPHLGAQRSSSAAMPGASTPA